MSESQQPPRRSYRQWSIAEKRQIVERTFQEGASVCKIARECGLSRNGLSRWRSLYRSGLLGPSAAERGAFVPVAVLPEPASGAPPVANPAGGSVLQLVLASGATLRIESAQLDAAFACAILAELRG